MTLDPATSVKISTYRPRPVPPEWPQVADTVRAMVAASVQMTDHNVERLLHAATRLAVWAERHGLPRDPEVWLRHETIDAFVLAELTPSSVQTYRSWLRKIRAALAWAERGEHPPPPMRAAHQVSAPYSPDQLAGLRVWTEHLPGRARADGLALMALAGGCGLAPGELVRIRGEHIRLTPSGMAVVAEPRLDRLIVARAAWEEHLVQAAQAAGEQYLFRPGCARQQAKNLIGSWCDRHRPGGGLPRMSARRLRSSWIVELLSARIDTAVVAATAGLASAAALARYQHFVPALDESTAAELLRGRR